MVIDHGNRLINHSLEILTIQEWIALLDAFQSLHGISKTNENPFHLLAGAPVEWRRKLLPYTFLLDELKKMLDSIEPTRYLCFEVIGRVYFREAAERILEMLQRRLGIEDDDTSVQVNILNHLAWNGQNVEDVLETLEALYSLSVDEYRVCIHVENLWRPLPHYIAQGFLEEWLTGPIFDAEAPRTIFRSLKSSADLSNISL